MESKERDTFFAIDSEKEGHAFNKMRMSVRDTVRQRNKHRFYAKGYVRSPHIILVAVFFTPQNHLGPINKV